MGGHGRLSPAIVRQDRQRPVPGSEDVGGADVARAGAADIAEPGQPDQDQAEGDGAQEIAARRGGIKRPSVAEISERVGHGSGVVDKDPAAVYHGAQHAALDRASIEGRVLRFAAEVVDLDLPGLIQVEQH